MLSAQQVHQPLRRGGIIVNRHRSACDIGTADEPLGGLLGRHVPPGRVGEACEEALLTKRQS
eukprot:12399187-Alexandrium_andersonii.AAC.1